MIQNKNTKIDQEKVKTIIWIKYFNIILMLYMHIRRFYYGKNSLISSYYKIEFLNGYFSNNIINV